MISQKELIKDIIKKVIFFLYRIFSNLALIFIPLVIFIRKRNGKELQERTNERYGKNTYKRKKGKLIWIHAASIGECQSILPIVDKLEKDQSINQILITSGTVTSAQVINKRIKGKVVHQFIPFDVPVFTNRFLNYWKPSLAVFVESEIWPNFIHNLNNKNIPQIIINGRMTIKSFKRWSLFDSSSKDLFSKFSSCSTQNTDSTLFYEKLGIKNTNYTGNLKFALTPDPTDTKKYDELKVLTGGRKIFLAASTHPGEEEIISRVTQKLKKTCKDLLTIVVPRHPKRNNIINQNIIKNTAIRSIGNKIKRNTHIYLADTIGELDLFYKLADIIFIGGSLVMHGGQNPIEAAYHGKKVYHGEYVENFSDVYMTLDQMKLSQIVKNERQLEHFIHEEYKNLDNKVIKVDVGRLKKEGEETVKKVLKEIYQYL